MILDGKMVAQRIKDEMKEKVADLNKQGISVGLTVIIVGDDPASRVYVNSKKKACEALGINSQEFALPADTTEEELDRLVTVIETDIIARFL